MVIEAGVVAGYVVAWAVRKAGERPVASTRRQMG